MSPLHLRRCQYKYSFGFFKNIFTPNFIKKKAVDNLDYRIHFALNCGAKDCPPVAVFSAENLDKEFDFMTKNYLKEQTTYNAETKTATSVSLFSWFRADFGGLCGAKKILAEYGATPEEPKELEFTNYDWTLSLGNFRELPNF